MKKVIAESYVPDLPPYHLRYDISIVGTDNKEIRICTVLARPDIGLLISHGHVPVYKSSEDSPELDLVGIAEGVRTIPGDVHDCALSLARGIAGSPDIPVEERTRESRLAAKT